MSVKFSTPMHFCCVLSYITAHCCNFSTKLTNRIASLCEFCRNCITISGNVEEHFYQWIVIICFFKFPQVIKIFPQNSQLSSEAVTYVILVLVLVLALWCTGAEPWRVAVLLRTGAEPLRCVLGRTRGVLGQTCDHSSTFATVIPKVLRDREESNLVMSLVLCRVLPSHEPSPVPSPLPSPVWLFHPPLYF